MGTAILAHVTEPGLEVLREVLPLFDWTGISLCPFLRGLMSCFWAISQEV
jgi:hypothetical protein